MNRRRTLPPPPEKIQRHSYTFEDKVAAFNLLIRFDLSINECIAFFKKHRYVRLKDINERTLRKWKTLFVDEGYPEESKNPCLYALNPDELDTLDRLVKMDPRGFVREFKERLEHIYSGRTFSGSSIWRALTQQLKYTKGVRTRSIHQHILMKHAIT